MAVKESSLGESVAVIDSSSLCCYFRAVIACGTPPIDLDVTTPFSSTVTVSSPFSTTLQVSNRTDLQVRMLFMSCMDIQLG